MYYIIDNLFKIKSGVVACPGGTTFSFFMLMYQILLLNKKLIRKNSY